MLSCIPKMISPTTPGNLGFELRSFPAILAVLTPDGFFPNRSDRPRPSFGGDPRTQLVGFTLCALGHLFDGEVAIRLFMHCIAPALLNDSRDGIKEAFAAQLIDNEQRILNEGTTCGLSARFEEGIANLKLPHHADEHRSPVSDFPFVGGLLKWLVQKRRTRYVTRSATVARVAACLKEAGWIIGPICTWINPDHPPPPSFDGVTLVLAGSLETDKLALTKDEDDLTAMKETGRYVHHYRNETVGSMLYVAMAGPQGLSPETLQTDFNNVREYIGDRLKFTWEVVRRDADGYDPELLARPKWRTEHPSSRKPTLSRLASLIFGPKTSEKVAACFKGLEPHLQSILDHDSSKSKEVPLAVKHLNAIAVCVLISIAELLGGSSYPSLRHSTQLDLSNPVDYEQRSALNCLSGITICLDGGLAMWRVVELLSIFHGGMGFSRVSDVPDSSCIGFQRGTYTVLPTLLYNMQPTTESLGFTCGNIFLANITASSDGRVFTGSSDSWKSHGVDIPEGVSDTVITHKSPFVAPPRSTPPDTALYLRFERPYNFYEPSRRNLLLAGRIGGELSGMSSIYDVLTTLVLSLGSQTCCRGLHQEQAKALVMNASTWVAQGHRRPMDASYCFNTYIPVRNDPCWALFLAGQIAGCDGRICFGCYDCTLEHAGRHPSTYTMLEENELDFPRVYIGFQ